MRRPAFPGDFQLVEPLTDHTEREELTFARSAALDGRLRLPQPSCMGQAVHGREHEDSLSRDCNGHPLESTPVVAVQ